MEALKTLSIAELRTRASSVGVLWFPTDSKDDLIKAISARGTSPKATVPPTVTPQKPMAPTSYPPPIQVFSPKPLTPILAPVATGSYPPPLSRQQAGPAFPTPISPRPQTGPIFPTSPGPTIGPQVIQTPIVTASPPFPLPLSPRVTGPTFPQGPIIIPQVTGSTFPLPLAPKVTNLPPAPAPFLPPISSFQPPVKATGLAFPPPIAPTPTFLPPISVQTSSFSPPKVINLPPVTPSGYPPPISVQTTFQPPMTVPTVFPVVLPTPTSPFPPPVKVGPVGPTSPRPGLDLATAPPGAFPVPIATQKLLTIPSDEGPPALSGLPRLGIEAATGLPPIPTPSSFQPPISTSPTSVKATGPISPPAPIAVVSSAFPTPRGPIGPQITPILPIVTNPLAFPVPLTPTTRVPPPIAIVPTGPTTTSFPPPVTATTPTSFAPPVKATGLAFPPPIAPVATTTPTPWAPPITTATSPTFSPPARGPVFSPVAIPPAPVSSDVMSMFPTLSGYRYGGGITGYGDTRDIMPILDIRRSYKNLPWVNKKATFQPGMSSRAVKEEFPLFKPPIIQPFATGPYVGIQPIIPQTSALGYPPAVPVPRTPPKTPIQVGQIDLPQEGETRIVTPGRMKFQATAQTGVTTAIGLTPRSGAVQFGIASGQDLSSLLTDVDLVRLKESLKGARAGYGVQDLKNLAKRYNLPVSGTKQEVSGRILVYLRGRGVQVD